MRNTTSETIREASPYMHPQASAPAELLRAVSCGLRRKQSEDNTQHSREPFTLPFTMAFQPIVNTNDHTVFAYEALVRGEGGEGAATVMQHITGANRYAFDNACRNRGLSQACELGLKSGTAKLSLNLSPNVVYDPNACIERTLDMANRLGFPVSRLIFELTEEERARDHAYLNRLLRAFRDHGVRVAIDDFGTGYAGLGMLAEFETDLVKIDMKLVRGVDTVAVNRAIVESIVQIADRMKIEVIAEGVETASEYETLASMGVFLMQGYYFVKPQLNALPEWTPAAQSPWRSSFPAQARMSACPPNRLPSPPKVLRGTRTHLGSRRPILRLPLPLTMRPAVSMTA